MQILPRNIKDLRADPKQPRRNIDPQQIKELSISLKNRGLINPIEVDTKGIIVTGQLRWEAAKLLGWEKIACRVLDITGEEKFLRQVHENIHNNSMTSWDTANALEKIGKILKADSRREFARGKFHQGKYFQSMVKEIAEEVGRAPSYISEHLNLLQETKEVREAAQSKGFKRTNIRDANTAPPAYRSKLKRKILKENITQTTVNKLAHHLRHATPEEAKKLLAVNYSKMDAVRAVDIIRNIAPGEIEVIQKTQDKADHIARLVTQLSDAMSSYPIAIFDSESRKMLIFSLGLFMKNIYRYIHNKPIEIQLKVTDTKNKKTK